MTRALHDEHTCLSSRCLCRSNSTCSWPMLPKALAASQAASLCALAVRRVAGGRQNHRVWHAVSSTQTNERALLEAGCAVPCPLNLQETHSGVSSSDKSWCIAMTRAHTHSPAIPVKSPGHRWRGNEIYLRVSNLPPYAWAASAAMTVNLALEIEHRGLPVVRNHVRIDSTGPVRPWTSPTTDPSLAFLTHPPRPSSVALAVVCLRKNTPCTRPVTTKAKVTSLSAASPRLANPAERAAAAIAQATPKFWKARRGCSARLSHRVAAEPPQQAKKLVWSPPTCMRARRCSCAQHEQLRSRGSWTLQSPAEATRISQFS